MSSAAMSAASFRRGIPRRSRGVPLSVAEGLEEAVLIAALHTQLAPGSGSGAGSAARRSTEQQRAADER